MVGLVVVSPTLVPRYSPHAKVGVAVHEYSPSASISRMSPALSKPGGIIGTGRGDTSCLVVKVVTARTSGEAGCITDMKVAYAIVAH
jgi:hypothetical protein